LVYRKSPHIYNIGRLTIVQPRELSRAKKPQILTACGIEYDQVIKRISELEELIEKEKTFLTNFANTLKIQFARASKSFEEEKCADQLSSLENAKLLTQEQSLKHQELMERSRRLEELKQAFSILGILA
jgi:hypothetical protein